MGVLYGVADKVGWIHSAAATKAGIGSIKKDTQRTQKLVHEFKRETQTELADIVQSLTFIKNTGTTKEEFQNLRQEVFEDLAAMKKIISAEIGARIDTVISMYQEHERALTSMLASESLFEHTLPDDEEDNSFVF